MRASWIWVSGAAALVVGGALAGWRLREAGYDLHVGTASPLSGHYGLHLSLWLIPLLVVALVIWRYRSMAESLRWPLLLLASFGTTLAWALSLALVEGPAAIAEPLTTPYEYLAEVDRVGGMDLGTFLRTFTDYIVESDNPQAWAVHVSGHPPLITLIFVGLDKIGLGASIWAALLCVVIGASATPSVLSTVRLLSGEQVARAAAPFVAVAPTALWLATSADALFTGVAAAGLAALARPRLALLGGLLLGACLYLSYGLVLLAPLALAVVVVQRRIRPLLIGLIPVVAIVVAFTWAGYWWWDGLQLVVQRIVEGGGYLDRPRLYFTFASIAALAVLIGPSGVASIPWAWRERRDLRLIAMPAAALVALAVAQISDLSKGEVERIYLPWAVWLLPMCALLPAGQRGKWFAATMVFTALLAVTTDLTW